MRICFFFEYRDLKGGYTNLIISLIKELYIQGIETVLFNFKDGLIANELLKSGVEINIVDLDTLDWKEIDEQIFSTDILLISIFLEVYHNFFNVNPRILYYDINDNICDVSKYKFGLSFHGLGKKFIQELLKNKSLIFMDNTGIDNLKNTFKLDIKEKVYLPLPVEMPEENIFISKPLNCSSSLNITYIGRSVSWKMMPLKKIIDDCVLLKFDKKIIITVVVDSITELKKIINLDTYINIKFIKIILFENLLPSQLQAFLLTTSDLHFGMGTAALDAAKLGIPTILIDASPNPFPEDYTYSWIFQSKDFSLGKFINKVKFEKGITMDALLSSIINSAEARSDYSIKSYEYVARYHSVKNIIPKLLDIVKNTEFRIKDARPYNLYFSRIHHILKDVLRNFIRKVLKFKASEIFRNVN